MLLLLLIDVSESLVLSVSIVQHFQVDLLVCGSRLVSIKAIATLVFIETIHVVCKSRRCHNGKGGEHCPDTQNVVRCLSLKKKLRTDDVADS